MVATFGECKGRNMPTTQEQREGQALAARVRRRVRHYGLRMVADRLRNRVLIFTPPPTGEPETRGASDASGYTLIVWGDDRGPGLTMTQAQEVFAGDRTPTGWTTVMPDDDAGLLRPAQYRSTGPVRVIL